MLPCGVLYIDNSHLILKETVYGKMIPHLNNDSKHSYLDISMYITTIPPHQGAVYQPLVGEMMDFIMVVVEAVITIPQQ